MVTQFSRLKENLMKIEKITSFSEPILTSYIVRMWSVKVLGRKSNSGHVKSVKQQPTPDHNRNQTRLRKHEQTTLFVIRGYAKFAQGVSQREICSSSVVAHDRQSAHVNV